MTRIESAKEIKYKTYRTRKDISTCEELLKAIINYCEVFYCIFRNAGNPIIKIKAYNPETKESLLNIADICFIAKGTKCNKQTIYSNANTPWHDSVFN